MSAVKKIVLSIGGILGVGIIGAGVFLATIDPNDYRDEIIQAVNQQTGRELQIGDMQLSLFPHLGLSLKDAQLSNAKGFEQVPFVAVNEVSVGVAILPLLQQQLQVDALTLSGLKLHLQRNPAGVNNWDDLTTASAPAETQTPEQKTEQAGNPLAKLAALNIGGVDIRDGEIIWQDDQAKQRVSLTPFSLTAGAVSLDEFFDIDLSVHTEVSQPQLKTESRLHAQVKLQRDGTVVLRNLKQTNRLNSQTLPFEQVSTDLAIDDLSYALESGQLAMPKMALHYDFKGANAFAVSQSSGELTLDAIGFDLNAQKLQSGPLKLNAELKGDAIPQGAAKLALSAQPALDLKAQTAALQNLQLEALNTRLNADIKVTDLTTAAKINAQAELLPTDVRALLKQLGMQLAAVDTMADKNALTRVGAQLDVGFDTAKQALQARTITLQMDDSTLSGQASVANFDKPNIAFNLNLDKIDLNRYLPPKADKPQTPPPAENKPAEDIEIPLPKELLRSLTVNGTLKASSVTFDKLNPQQIVATLKGQNGVFNLNPLKMNLFNRPLSASAKLDVSGNEAKYAFKTDAQNVPVGDVLLAFTGDDRVSGLGTVKADLTTAGERLSSIKQHLNGTAAVNLKDGAIKGFNLAQSIRQAKAKIAGEKAAGPTEELKTDFSELIAEVAIVNGVVDTRKLQAQAPFMRISGSGQVDLVKESLDYLVKTKIVASDKGQGGEELKELNGLTIPVKLKGAWTSPDVGLDLGAILEQKAKQEVEQKIEEKKEEVKKQFEEQLQQNLFKGLKF